MGRLDRRSAGPRRHSVCRRRRNRYWVFHLFGFADFVVAVGTGLTYFLLNDPRMSGIQTLPMALIPFYGVGISGASHIMAFDLLRRRPGSNRNDARRCRQEVTKQLARADISSTHGPIPQPCVGNHHGVLVVLVSRSAALLGLRCPDHC